MRLKQAFIFFSLLAFMSCKKNGSGAQTSGISVGNVAHTRDTVNTTLKFTISVEPVSDKTVTVDYKTVEGTAKANVDFVPVSGTLTISPNTNQAQVEVQIIGRKLVKSLQNFSLKLTNPVNAIIKVDNATAGIQNPGFGYVLVWSDEFTGTVLNTGDWNYETGGGGWGNNELQNYTSGTNNAYIDNGNLVIEAKKENSGSNNYTSARLTTKGKIKFTYGKIDIRAKIPATKGIWPALWMLGENIDQAGWPACGEIDIMESINKEQPSKVYGTAHWGSSGSHQSSGGNLTLASGYYSDDFHVFTLEWSADQLKWFIDSNLYYQLNKAQITGGAYPFDKEFFFIMNVAVGGNWPGNPDATSVFPQKMLVDYIRIYQK